MTNLGVLLQVCLQIAVILAACGLVALAGRRFGQAKAVCDMITGVLLGPSLFGLVAVGLQSRLFPATLVVHSGASRVVVPHPAMSVLYVLAQVGVAMYMFLVGLEFDVGMLRFHGRKAGALAFAGMVTPFALGAAVAVWVVRPAGLFAAGIQPSIAAIFLALSLSITAFPVLARILQEQGAATTSLGTLVLAAAALNDAVAWCLLAVLLALVGGAAQTAALTLGGTALYALVMGTLGRRGLARLADQAGPEQMHGLSISTLTVVLILLFLCSWYTMWIGLHQILGAFVLGVCMPRGRVAAATRRQMEPLTVGLLLPIFFVYSGLSTQIGLLRSPVLWGIAALITALAILGKGGACFLAARASGQTWRESGAIGALMNSRGLIELVLLNIGLEQHLITPALFSILVLMAIVTTAMTTPLFRALRPRVNASDNDESGNLTIRPSVVST